jgi:RES domain-containing protein
MLEVLVHLKEREEGLPRIYTLLKIEAPDDLAVKQLNTIAPADWKEHPEFTRQIGDAWLASLETPLARVPSAIAPRTWNYLLNPEHPDAKQMQVAEMIKEQFDNRLFRFGPR